MQKMFLDLMFFILFKGRVIKKIYLKKKEVDILKY